MEDKINLAKINGELYYVLPADIHKPCFSALSFNKTDGWRTFKTFFEPPSFLKLDVKVEVVEVLTVGNERGCILKQDVNDQIVRVFFDYDTVLQFAPFSRAFLTILSRSSHRKLSVE